MSFGIVPYLLLKIKTTQDLLHYFIEMLRVFRSAGSVAANNGSNDTSGLTPSNYREPNGSKLVQARLRRAPRFKNERPQAARKPQTHLTSC